MRITIDVDLSDDLLDLSQCHLYEFTEIVEHGDRKEPVKMNDTDFNPIYNGYEVIDCDYDALEAHLKNKAEDDYPEPTEYDEWQSYDPDC